MNPEFREVTFFTVCFIWKGISKRKCLRITIAKNRVTIFGSHLLEFLAIFLAFSELPGRNHILLSIPSSQSGWGRTIQGDKRHCLGEICLLWTRWAGKLDGNNPLQPLAVLWTLYLFRGHVSSMTHKKHICCFIYYLPDMLLVTRVGNHLSTQFLFLN